MALVLGISISIRIVSIKYIIMCLNAFIFCLYFLFIN